MMRNLQSALGWIFILALAACSGAPEEEPGERPAVVAPEEIDSEIRGWAAIEESGRLRLLVPASAVQGDNEAAEEDPIAEQIGYAARFARSLDLEPVLVPIEHAEELIPALAQGLGDVLIANMPMLSSYRDRIAFTVPLDRSKRLLVARTDDPIADLADLSERTLTVPFASPLWETARSLQYQYPGLQVESLPALDMMENLDLVAGGEIDLTLAESNFLERVLEEREELRTPFPVSNETGIAWAVRPEAEETRTLLNRFITQQKLVQPEREMRTADLSAMRAARTLRLATRNSAANYFIWRGQLLGFEYELADRLARELNLRLEVVVADDGESLLDLVRTGEADMAAAFLSPIGRDRDRGIAWSRPYHRAEQTVVGQGAAPPIRDLQDLAGRTFHVHETGRYARTLRLISQIHDLDVEIESVPPGQEPEGTLQKVADGDYDLTLVDDHLVRNAMLWIDGLRPQITLGNEISHHWAVREDNPELLATIDEFLERHYRGTFYNALYAKYFRDQERARGFSAQRLDLQHGREISPWDDLVRTYAHQYGFDWRLILAQIYQESSFNPEARSWVGASGLMQIMPRTAQELGVSLNELTDPEINVHAGIRYMAWLRNRFEEDLRIHDRMWFMLAAYNAGIGHVRDARRLAAELGYDPDRWFDNVEVAMEKLSHREYFQHARYGYVRGHEPVGYVRNIRKRYQAYILWTEDCWPVCSDGPHPDQHEPGQRAPTPGGVLHQVRH